MWLSAEEMNLPVLVVVPRQYMMAGLEITHREISQSTFLAINTALPKQSGPSIPTIRSLRHIDLLSASIL